MRIFLIFVSLLCLCSCCAAINTNESVGDMQSILPTNAPEVELSSVLFTFTADMDGNGVDDEVFVRKETINTTNEAGDEVELDSPYHISVTFVINKESYNKSFYDLFAFDTTAFIVDSFDGKCYLTIALDIGGTGAGNYALKVLNFNKDDIYELPVPKKAVGEYLYGFDAVATYIDDYQLSINVLENDYTVILNLERDQYKNKGIYSNEGKLIATTPAYATIDGICEVTPVSVDGRTNVELVQYIWGEAHSQKIGWLKTIINWDGAEYIIIKQDIE